MNVYPTDILLIEDNEDDANLSLRVFKKSKLVNKVHWLRTGEEALDFIFGTGPYHGQSASQGKEIILLDLQLPEMSGVDVLRRIKLDERTKSMKVIILTGALPHERGVMQSYKLGALACIVKPITLSKFFEAICEVGLNWAVLAEEAPLGGALMLPKKPSLRPRPD